MSQTKSQTNRPAWRFKHFANIGDLIASLPAMKAFNMGTGRKVIVCQQINVPGSYYHGAVHPTLDDNGTQVMCNQKMFDMIRPLLLSQDYIEDAEVYNGQPINVDLDTIRNGVFVNMPYGSLQQWHFLAKPDLAYDLSQKWIDIGEVDISNCGYLYDGLTTSMMPADYVESKIIINFTERYRNAAINYYFLKQCQGILVFAGTVNEHKLFCEKWELDIPLLYVENFLQLAYIIKKAKFLLSNQSFMWNASEAMKTPRVLELCDHAPNCQAFIGEHSYGFFKQQGLEYYFRLLLNRK